MIMRYISSRHPLAEHNPLRSVPFMHTRAEVFGPTPLEAAQIKLAQFRSYLPSVVDAVAYSRQVLGRANRMPKVSRRRWQANAMRGINRARTALRRLLKDIATAEASLLALAHRGGHANPRRSLPRSRHGFRAVACRRWPRGPHQAAPRPLLAGQPRECRMAPAAGRSPAHADRRGVTFRAGTASRQYREEDQPVPIYDVTLTRRDETAPKRSLKVEGVSAASAWEATNAAIKTAAGTNPDWADATDDNTDAAITTRN